MFPLTLIGPGLNPDPLPHPQPIPPSNANVSGNSLGKRKRTTPSIETPSVGGFGPLSPADTTTETPSPSPSPPPFTPKGRRNAASDVWAFVRPLATAEELPMDQWLTSELHEISRPTTPWFGCKLCSEFGYVVFPSAHLSCVLMLPYHRDNLGTKRWRVFQNKQESSPTTSFRRHLVNHHESIWERECARLNIAIKHPAKEATLELASETELFTKDGLLKRLIKFISSDDQVRLIDPTFGGHL